MRKIYPDKSRITVKRSGLLVAEPNGSDDLKASNSLVGKLFRPQRYDLEYRLAGDGTWKLENWKISGGMLKKDGTPGGVDGDRHGWRELDPEDAEAMPWLSQLVQDNRPTVVNI